MTTRRETHVKGRRLYVLLAPDGSMYSVVDAKNETDAWFLASGWEDETRIMWRKDQGWKIKEATVEFW